mmetsp:Transcript_19919/g.40349  ORF Transcript_19919/g.40349 Transcript_19919/m.40349 type:complete len:185 (-) Transcript_19919:275-829(-)|eukprot:CAMPEP_0183300258 /NCGR_PEP_ID=MMETSP0160_2-20130417/6748_1 /TAXON_ID=2839 ORGANISM="Odontella Sinensis, Strain Grunow 1884" /NCGR_SAMPLE_ID=MMETSP0160_2 /ASSEMBLY_ACC=CAM_ASM_000250 /LENGTH=184 /DNA_ID=CAMNT_0025462645 /DNA_START=47 /DNA_END=604 /DNA_ORIENTATION=-
MTTVSASRFPDLPLTCLETAELKSTTDIFQGNITVVDFWTTKCTRCPDALDKLDKMSGMAKFSRVDFISICCDSCDGARNIIEHGDELRWPGILHYFMEEEHKERAKEVLGFRQVPFYVILNEEGKIIQKGSEKKIDFEAISEDVSKVEEGEQSECDDGAEKTDAPPSPTTVRVDRVFIMDADF